MNTAVDTTHNEGVLNETERPLSARELSMAAVEQRFDDQLLAQEGGTKPETIITTEDPAEIVIDDPSRYKVRVMVGGRNEERPISAIIQELETAKGRLRKNNQEMEAREKSVAEREKQIELANAVSSIEDPEGDELIQAGEMIVDGRSDEFAKILRNVIRKEKSTEAAPAAATASREEIIEDFKAQEASRQVWVDFLRDNPEFSEPRDEAGNPVMDGQGNLVRSREREFGDKYYDDTYKALVDDGEISYQEALTNTAKATRKHFSSPPEVPGKTTRDEKLERKREIDNLAIAAGARQGGPADEQEESRADTLKAMRKARGLPA